MGREIEIKIPLMQQEYEDFLEIFIKQTKSVNGIFVSDGRSLDLICQPVVKMDEYYSKYNTRDERKQSGEPQVIRLRTEKSETESKTFFTLKRKTLQNGIELNKEDETLIEEPDVLRDFFAVAGYKKWFHKEKHAFGVYCKSDVNPSVEFHVELERVNDLPYMEIEVTQESGDAAEIKQSLFDFVALLGIDSSRKDSRSWVEILTSK